MENKLHKRIILSYETYADNEAGIHELLEKTSPEHPFQFITGMGLALDAFERQTENLESGAEFDFNLSVDESYGPYMPEHVIELEKEMFSPAGHFDSAHVYPGAVIPLENSEGLRFQGLVKEIKDKAVVVDLNHPWAGKALHFKGRIIEARPATDEEITGMLNMMSGEGCCCGCGGGDCHCGDDDCEGGCHGGEGHHEGGCCGHCH